MTEGYEGPAPSAVSSGLSGRCPRCGAGGLFRGFLTLKPACDACGLDYSFADSGDGPAFFITSIVGFVVAGGALLLELAYEPPFWVHALVWPPVIVLLCLALLRPAKGLMIALQYRNRAGQGRRES